MNLIPTATTNKTIERSRKAEAEAKAHQQY
jgi:hypothetical protein